MRAESYLTTTLGMYISPNPRPVTTLCTMGQSDEVII